VVGTDRLTLDVPASLEYLDGVGEGERAVGEARAERARLGDARRVGDEDAARAEGLLGVGHDLPGLGEVEHDAVEVGAVDALVAVALLDVVALEVLRAEERLDVAPGPRREVGPQLVAGGKMSASIRIGPRSFG
jgi:hypothetical protein